MISRKVKFHKNMTLKLKLDFEVNLQYNTIIIENLKTG
jgi:hypothetical protein